MNLCFGKKNILDGEIILSHADGEDKEVYLGGETVSGKVVLKDNEPISRKDLCLSFVGELDGHRSAAPTIAGPSPSLNRKIEFHRTNIHISSLGSANLTVVSNCT